MNVMLCQVRGRLDIFVIVHGMKFKITIFKVCKPYLQTEDSKLSQF